MLPREKQETGPSRQHLSSSQFFASHRLPSWVCLQAKTCRATQPQLKRPQRKETYLINSLKLRLKTCVLKRSLNWVL